MAQGNNKSSVGRAEGLGMDTKQCIGCRYWRPLGDIKGENACHYLLDTEKARKRDGNKCLSYNPSKTRIRYRPFTLHNEQ